MPLWISSAAKNMGGGLWAKLTRLIQVVLTLVWDNGLVLLNLVLPKKAVKPKEWPPFVPRKETDSRSPCPALNALAAHGIFPHDGRNIKFTEMGAKVHEHFNFAPSFCYFVCSFMAGILHRDYRTGTLDLGDMCLHNGIEHDGSITRFDSTRQPDQSYPAAELIHALLASSKDGKKITAAELSHFITERRAHSKATNPQFSLDTFHSYFGASNAATLLRIFGGDVETIRSFLLEERIPEGWTSSMRSRMGLTMASFNGTSMRVLLGVDPKWKKARKTD